ncbi:MAG: AmpE protein [Gammaproteobacteria bacterium]|jgi:AmpE protein
MTLISILLGMALEYFLGALDHLRNRDWFDQYNRWLEARFSANALWEGPTGVLLTLAPPLALLVLIAHLLAGVSVIFAYLMAIVVFVYSLGPDFNTLINTYIHALEEGDKAAVEQIEGSLFFHELSDDKEQREKTAIETVLLCAHEHIFGVIFWFITLGMLGALMYCLVVRLEDRFEDIRGGYADAIRNLHHLLMWPSARLQALGFALGGSLVDALEGWRSVEGDSLSISKEIIATSGLWALQYQPELTSEFNNETESYINWIKEAQALANRTLIVWLTILGVMTLGGWLA